MIFKCKMCGGELTFEEGASVCECEYCGSKQTLPKQDDEKKLKLFERANRLRLNCEFDKAGSVYEQIIAEFPEEAEAYWGNLLCKYGIEYVDDPKGDKVPTCHRSSFDCVLHDPDFDMVMENADSISRAVYREQAKAIEEIRKGIIEVSGKEQPYDIFICYKETDENGGRTLDSVLAQDVYEALTGKGYRVFFSRISLEDKLGTEYEPYIFAALNSAKVMLAFGTSYDHYNAVWVKNEWSRYLKLMAADKEKHLIPCYKDIDAYDMPKEFARLQAQDMGQVGAVQDLLRGIDKLTGRAEQEQKTMQPNSPGGGQSVTINNLMQRVSLFLEDRNWKEASAYINKVLDIDAKYAPAYVAKVLAKNQLTSETALQKLRSSIDGDSDWQKALRFASASEKKTYEAIAKNINANEAFDKEQAAKKARAEAEEAERKAKAKAEEADRKAKAAAEEAKRKAAEKSYVQGTEAMKQEYYAGAICAFNGLGEYRDSREQLRTCMEAYRKELAAKEAVKALFSTVREKTDAERRSNEVSLEIQKLERELREIHGLFSGGKKRDLERKIETLSQERRNINGKFCQLQKELETKKEELSRAAAESLTDEDVIAAAAAAAATDTAWQPGKYVTFGRYDQDNNKSNGAEAIEWRVLAREGDKALILSKYGLDAKPYNKDWVDITWEKCTLRTWLNEEFVNTAFDSTEQARIQLMAVDNSKAQGYSKWNTDGGNDTQDKVFLLSYAEANKYLGVTYDNRNNTDSRVSPTVYAEANGAYTSSSNKTAEGAYAGWWWLRSPGIGQDYASGVHDDGSLYSYIVDYDSGVVRPALWVEIS